MCDISLFISAVGLRVLELLTNAAKRGVKIVLVFDDYGSKKLPASATRALEQAGANVVRFNRVVDWDNLGRPGSIVSKIMLKIYRLHSKVLAVDDRVAFCGGMNMAEEYAGRSVGGIALYRDTMLRVEGPGAVILRRMVQSTLAEGETREQVLEAPGPSTVAKYIVLPKKKLRKTDRSSPATPVSSPDELHDLLDEEVEQPASSPAQPVLSAISSLPKADQERTVEGVAMQVLQSDVRKERRAIQRYYRHLVRGASHTIHITDPYFLPSPRVLQAVCSAAKRGLDIKIVTTSIIHSDAWMSHWASRHIYSRVLQSGINVYELSDQPVHAKTVVVDGIYLCSAAALNLCLVCLNAFVLLLFLWRCQDCAALSDPSTSTCGRRQPIWR